MVHLPKCFRENLISSVVNNYSSNGVNAQLAEYETPFADVPLQKEESPQNESPEL